MSDPFFDSYLERLENLQKNVHETVAGLPPEAWDWTPGPEMNSIAVLLAHTAGSLRYYIGDVAQADPSNRVRELEFQTTGISSQELLERLESAIGYAHSTLPGLKLSDLDQQVLSDGKPMLRDWALLHAPEHAYLHLGHIQMTSQLWKQHH